MSASQAGNFWYYPTAATATFTVAPATVGILPDDATATAGSSIPPLGYRLSGLRNGDAESVVTGQASCTTTANAASPPGDYPITCNTGTLHAANYVFAAAGAATLDLDAPDSGYALIGADGSVWALGPARLVSAPAPAFYGSMAGHVLDAPVVGGAFTPLHDGYWLVASDGGIFAFGDAGFFGSMGGRALNRPIVGVAGTPDGRGYWEVASDGGIFAFGDAGFFGSTGNIVLNQPIVGMASTPDGRGYWLVAADGGIFAFGDAGFYGSTGGEAIGQRVVGMAAAPAGQGYWLTTASGSVFPFGRAAFEGSLRFLDLGFPVVGMAATGDGDGYWLVAPTAGCSPSGMPVSTAGNSHSPTRSTGSSERQADRSTRGTEKQKEAEGKDPDGRRGRTGMPRQRRTLPAQWQAPAPPVERHRWWRPPPSLPFSSCHRPWPARPTVGVQRQRAPAVAAHGRGRKRTAGPVGPARHPDGRRLPGRLRRPAPGGVARPRPTSGSSSATSATSTVPSAAPSASCTSTRTGATR